MFETKTVLVSNIGHVGYLIDCYICLIGRISLPYPTYIRHASSCVIDIILIKNTPYHDTQILIDITLHHMYI